MRWLKVLFSLSLVVELLGLQSRAAVYRAPTPESTPALSQQDAEAAIRGRLGGVRAGFEEALGGPGIELSGSGTLYDVAGYGMVMVSYLVPQATPAPTDVAVVIILRSERPEDTPADQPSERDWTLDEAAAQAREFLPVDVELGQAVASDEGGRLSVTCRSAALAAVFAEDGQSGQCQVTYLQTSAGDVSFVTLALGSGSASADAPVSCDGMESWSHLAAANMAKTQELVGRLAELSADDPETVPALREIATAFGRLATVQELAPVPSAASEANRAMVATFRDYASSFAQAAAAMEAQDSVAFEDAIALVEQASASYVEADQLILEALETCHLVSHEQRGDTARETATLRFSPSPA